MMCRGVGDSWGYDLEGSPQMPLTLVVVVVGFYLVFWDSISEALSRVKVFKKTSSCTSWLLKVGLIWWPEMTVINETGLVSNPV
jgi:hypothetical protein